MTEGEGFSEEGTSVPRPEEWEGAAMGRICGEQGEEHLKQRKQLRAKAL